MTDPIFGLTLAILAAFTIAAACYLLARREARAAAWDATCDDALGLIADDKRAEGLRGNVAARWHG